MTLDYDDANPAFSLLERITQSGHVSGTDSLSLPPMEFEYQPHAWNQTVRAVDDASLIHLPAGVDGEDYRWVDLNSEGLPGVLTSQGGGLYYKENLGEGNFAAAQPVAPRPSFAALARYDVQIQDLAGDGRKQLVSYARPDAGFFELTSDGEWRGYRPFRRLPTADPSDPNARFIDLDGDGKSDLLITEDQVFRWYPSEGEEGFGEPMTATKQVEEEKGPTIVFSDSSESVYLADMSGDGLQDIVRIRNGSVCYWPNLGYGVFGAKVKMSDAPRFDRPDAYDPSYIRLADLDGSGPTDLVYLAKNEFRYWLNLSGNGWSPSHSTINPFPNIDDQTRVVAMDLLGSGTSCIVWSSQLPKHGRQPLRYIDLMGGKKPYVLTGFRNNLGKEVSIAYEPSTHYYLMDKQNGEPWVTRLPFPVQCVDKVVTLDRVSNIRFASAYKYHHGYFDHVEREFRGFGRVDQTDSETFQNFVSQGASGVTEEDLDQPPVVIRTWFHTGAFLDRQRILSQFEHEYYQNQVLPERPAPEPELPDGLSAVEYREALRALKGMVLRQETYALDGSTDEADPYTVVQSAYQLRLVQKRGPNRHASLQALPAEELTYHYERNPGDPRISHSLTLATDAYGNPLKSAVVGYPRQGPDPVPPGIAAEQAATHILITETNYTVNDIDDDVSYRLRVPCETRSFELRGATPLDGFYFSPGGLLDSFLGASPIGLEQPFGGGLEKRLLKHARAKFTRDDLSGPLAFQQLGALGLAHSSLQLALTPQLAADIYGAKVTNSLFLEGGYVHSEGDANWWVPSGEAVYPGDAADNFYLPSGHRDPLGNLSTVEYDDYGLFVTKTRAPEPIANQTLALHGYHALQPIETTDANGNRVAVETDALGMVTTTALMGKPGVAEGDTLSDPCGRSPVHRQERPKHHEGLHGGRRVQPGPRHHHRRGLGCLRWQHRRRHRNDRSDVEPLLPNAEGDGHGVLRPYPCLYSWLGVSEDVGRRLHGPLRGRHRLPLRGLSGSPQAELCRLCRAILCLR